VTHNGQQPDQESALDEGFRIRREVLGDAYVAAATHNATAFTRPLQELVTEYCWGKVWSRPGLDRRTRSLINIAMLAALNRQNELATHVRGAIRNSCTADEISEVILQAAIYCGVPAALEASRTAQAALAGLDDAAGAR
jgi:4-carboxymuconolactone decarboxylase